MSPKTEYIMLTSIHTNNEASQIMALFSKMPFAEQSRLMASLSTEYERTASLRKRFDELYKRWWQETCMYSGRNLCLNSTYKKIMELGPQITEFINNLASSEPDYKQRHIQWLYSGIQQISK